MPQRRTEFVAPLATVTGAHQRTGAQATRVAVFTNISAPYRDELFVRLAPRVDRLDVYYSEEHATDRRWNTLPVDDDHRLRPLVRVGGLGPLSRGVVGAVRRADVVVVCGYDQPNSMLALLVARLLRRRTVLFFDGIAPSRIVHQGRSRWVKAAVARLAHVCLVNGSIGHRYFRDSLRVPERKLRNQVLVPVPRDPHGRVSDSGLAPEIEQVEQVEGDRVDVLYVGRLIARKGPLLVADAIRLSGDLSVAFGGSGPLEHELEAAVQGLDARLLGEIGVDEVASWMRRATCLVVPSVDEPWGLVVQEAMEVDLPVVAGVDMGCTEDLVIDGGNGVVVSELTPESLLEAIRRACAIPRARVSDTNRRLLATWNIDAHVEAFAAAITGNEPTRPAG